MSAGNNLPRVAVGALGGTVSMCTSESGQGVTPRLDAAGMLATVPQLSGLAEYSVSTLCLEPSASLGFDPLLDVLRWAKKQVEEGAEAVVLTQGTDSLEESAWFLDLLWPLEAPLILTGAMRAACHPGADGPANLLAAVQVALAAQSRGRGVQVVINDQVHSAARVRKTHSLVMAAFDSPGFGPCGWVSEGVVRYLSPPARRSPLPEPSRTGHAVALLEACLDADTRLLEQVVLQGYEGLVVAGFGAGHVSAEWARQIERVAREMPVIIGTRTGSGMTAFNTYGSVGGEIDLRGRGALMAGFLCPRKCRVLLWLLLGCNRQKDLPRYLEMS